MLVGNVLMNCSASSGAVFGNLVDGATRDDGVLLLWNGASFCPEVLPCCPTASSHCCCGQDRIAKPHPYPDEDDLQYLLTYRRAGSLEDLLAYSMEHGVLTESCCTGFCILEDETARQSIGLKALEGLELQVAIRGALGHPSASFDMRMTSPLGNHT